MNDAKQLLMQMAKGWRKINSPMFLIRRSTIGSFPFKDNGGRRI